MPVISFKLYDNKKEPWVTKYANGIEENIVDEQNNSGWVVQVPEPHTFIRTHEGKGIFDNIYINSYIRKKVLFFGSTKDEHLMENLVVIMTYLNFHQ